MQRSQINQWNSQTLILVRLIRWECLTPTLTNLSTSQQLMQLTVLNELWWRIQLIMNILRTDLPTCACSENWTTSAWIQIQITWRCQSNQTWRNTDLSKTATEVSRLMRTSRLLQLATPTTLRHTACTSFQEMRATATLACPIMSIEERIICLIRRSRHRLLHQVWLNSETTNIMTRSMMKSTIKKR